MSSPTKSDLSKTLENLVAVGLKSVMFLFAKVFLNKSTKLKKIDGNHIMSYHNIIYSW